MGDKTMMFHVLSGMNVSDPHGDSNLTADEVIKKHNCK